VKIYSASISCRIEFSASHYYRVSGWSEEENERRFGKDSRHHGHNYRVEIMIQGKVNPETGMVMNVRDLKKTIKEVVEPLDHKNLNEEVPYFRTCLPTPENLACYFFEVLSLKIQSARMASVRVYETESLWAEYRGEAG
jgi:6-pyruvoyltetrahydropterin/6-carboxytetrahydropterin synthase